MQPSEQTVYSTKFGVITDRRVRYQKKSIFGLGGGSQDDIPLRHITSVGLSISRHPFLGLMFFVFGFILLSQSGASVFIGLASLALAVLALWGSPEVRLSTAGQERRFVAGPPWRKREAEQFVQHLRGQIFKDVDTDAMVRWG